MVEGELHSAGAPVVALISQRYRTRADIATTLYNNRGRRNAAPRWLHCRRTRAARDQWKYAFMYRKYASSIERGAYVYHARRRMIKARDRYAR